MLNFSVYHFYNRYKIDDFIENDGKLYKNEPYYRYQIKY